MQKKKQIEILNESLRGLEEPYSEVFPEIDIDALEPSQEEIDSWIRWMDLPEMKSCEECGITFTPKRSDQIYCSKKCRDRVKTRRYRERQKNIAG